MRSFRANRFEDIAAGGTLVVEDGPGGWKTTGNTGGGHTGHDGKVC